MDDISIHLHILIDSETELRKCCKILVIEWNFSTWVFTEPILLSHNSSPHLQVSHEIRTPLTLIMGPLADCTTDTSSVLSPRSLSSLKLATRNTKRLLRLVNSLLDFSVSTLMGSERIYLT